MHGESKVATVVSFVSGFELFRVLRKLCNRRHPRHRQGLFASVSYVRSAVASLRRVEALVERSGLQRSPSPGRAGQGEVARAVD